MTNIVSTRFNDLTWEENIEYRTKYSFQGAIYGAPQPLSAKIDLNNWVFVIEMNNTQNKVMGIGLIRNMHVTDKYYKVYGTGNYNRYIYVGKHRIDREQLSSDLLQALDYILFKGKTHLKRGSGMTIVPEKLLRHPMCNEMNMLQEMKKAFAMLFVKKE